MYIYIIYIYIYYIKTKTKTSQSEECLQTPWNLFSAKFTDTANELGQERIKLRD